MRCLSRLLRTLAGAVVICAIVSAVLIMRGFRATNEPSTAERAVARSIRHLSIPRSDQHRQNPMQPSAENLQAGRELFLAQCASCHGIDARGRTRMGRNLSPRVPDLRSQDTQNLSDGEIHYIIANGVELTGMPAWKSPQESDDQLWQLVLFIRSLRPLTNNEQQAQQNVLGVARYVGSKTCEKCHAAIYQRWKKTPMANVVRDPREHPDSIAQFSLDQVAFVYGSLWKQRYFTKIGDDYFPLPAQWEVKNHAWSRYF